MFYPLGVEEVCTTVPLAAPREVELLLCCACVRMTPEAAARAKHLVAGDVDWEHLLQLAVRNRLLPLLHRNLQRLCPGQVPEAVMKRLHAHAGAVVFNGLSRTAELVSVLKRFEAEGIPVQVLKGPVLAAEAYHDLGLRPFDDLDLLVPRADIARCKALLLEVGYHSKIALGADEEAAYLDAQFAYCFERERSGTRVAVELHWALTHRSFPFALPDGTLWANPYPTEIAGHRVFTLPPEEQLLFLCVHGAKHEWCQLLLVTDVAALIAAHPGLDWARLQALAEVSRSVRMLHLGLYLAHHLLGTVLPPAIAGAVEADRVVPELAVWAVREALYAPLGGSSRREVIGFHMRVREHVRDTLRLRLENYRLLVQPSDKDRRFVALPAPFSFLYYVIRPFRVIANTLAQQ